jgi:hypothetical protein
VSFLDNLEAVVGDLKDDETVTIFVGALREASKEFAKLKQENAELAVEAHSYLSQLLGLYSDE